MLSRNHEDNSFDSFRETPSNNSRPMQNQIQNMSKVLPIYYLLVSFVFIGCQMNMCFLIYSKQVKLVTNQFFGLALAGFFYQLVLLFTSIKIMMSNLSENRDMIATSLIFLMLQRAVLIPLSIYLSSNSYTYWQSS